MSAVSNFAVVDRDLRVWLNVRAMFFLDTSLNTPLSASVVDNAAPNLNAWSLVVHASPVVQGVLAILVVMSIASWFIIGAKWMQLSRMARESQRFLKIFWNAEANAGFAEQHLDMVHRQAGNAKDSPLARIFQAAYLEMSKVVDLKRAAPETDMRSVESVERTLKRSSLVELSRMESLVSLLATTGSTAPFIGLFGTVWGIMYAITSLHAQSLPIVTQQIAEALIATAIGLAAAIPAVMAYNFFVRKIKVLEGEIDAFSNDYLNVIQQRLNS